MICLLPIFKIWALNPFVTTVGTSTLINQFSSTQNQNKIPIHGMADVSAFVNPDNKNYLSPGVYFSLSNGWGTYPGNAIISFDGTNYTYNPVLGGTLIYCSQGKYNFVITPEDESKAIFRGTVSVTSNSIETVGVEIADAHRINFYITGQQSESIKGAEITLGGVTLLTDETGLASFGRVQLGTYTYSITKSGYTSIINQSMDVTAQVETKQISLIPALYSITFTISGNGYPVSGAKVRLSRTEYVSDAEGLVTFSNLPMGLYGYTISKAGYRDETGIIEITEGDVVQIVTMILITKLNPISDNILKVFPNPTSGYLFISLPNLSKGEVWVEITDCKGRVILHKMMEYDEGQIKLDVSKINTGTYFLSISGNTITAVYKVIKT